jgi:4-amino-4-deoxy-L-arabinose transferase-like glycosyltransferase
MILYVNNYVLYIIIKTILILIYPLILILKSHTRNIFTLVASFLLLCGISALLNQYLKYDLWSSLIISFLLIVFVGVIPKFMSKAKENESLVVLEINNHKIRAFVDSGILLPATTCEDLNIILNRDVAVETLTNDQYCMLLSEENTIEFETATASENRTSMSWISIDNIIVRKNKKTKKVSSKVYLSKVRLPYEALISSLNI